MRSGRHRGQGYLGTGGRAAVVTVVLLLVVAGLVTWRSVGSGGCSGQLHLSVAAAPEIAPALRDTASAWASTTRGPAGQCIAVDVSAATPLDVAVGVATAGGVALTGGTPPATPAPVPDVWVPDSSTWLLRVLAAGPNLVPAQPPSIARSPVVLAMPEPVAATLGWPNAKLTWTALLQRMTAGPALKVGIVEPNRDAVGLAGLLSLGGAAASAGADAEQATIAAMRALVTGRANAPADLLGRFPKAADPAAIAAGLSAAPLSEQELIAYNAAKPAVRLAALYVDPAPAALDYPFAVMPSVTGDKARIAQLLLGALTGSTYRDRLAAAGLRGPDGGAIGNGFPALPGAPAAVTVSTLDGPTVGKALATWTSVTRPARMLAVFDVSGSMLTPVPTAGGATRAQVAIAAAMQGMALFDDSWAVGLWEFATNLDGDKDYKQLLPIRPMSEQRAKLQAALTTVAPIPNGNTGLYDTVLAAYKTVQAGWDPASVNSVVLLTDGINTDTTGLTLDQLIDALKATLDTRRPIQVIAIGMGTDVSEAELQRITSTTGGGTFIARDPSAIGPIFLKALSLRPPPPSA